MPQRQYGRVDKPPSMSSWRARWFDEAGIACSKRGFRTKTEALAFLRRETDRVEKLRRGDRVPISVHEMPTVQALIDEFLAQYVAEANSVATLTYRLRHAGDAFGTLPINRLTMQSVAAWRKKLPPGSAWHIHKALRQILKYAVRAGYISSNVASEVPNPEPKREEVVVFQTQAEVAKVAAGLDSVYQLIPILAADTGLRPEEWLALERADVEIDRKTMTGLLHVRRVYTGGELKHHGKTPGSLRTVAMTPWSVEAFLAHPPRIDTRLLLPGGEPGGYLNLHTWRSRDWTTAVEQAGLHVDAAGNPVARTPYSLRHTYASWCLAAGIDIFTLARRMGTSVDQIEKTYGHTLHGSLEAERDALTAFHAARNQASRKARGS